MPRTINQPTKSVKDYPVLRKKAKNRVTKTLYSWIYVNISAFSDGYEVGEYDG